MLQFRTATHDAIDGHVEGSTKIECDVRDGRKTVQIAQPALRAISRHIARERGVDVPVGKDQVAAVKQGKYLAFAAVGEISGVEERKRGGCQQPALLSAPRRRFHERGRIPFREMQAIAADFQPPLEQVELRAFPGAVYALNHNECTRVSTRGREKLRCRRRQFGWFDWDGFSGRQGFVCQTNLSLTDDYTRRM